MLLSHSALVPVYGVQNNLVTTSPTVLSPTGSNTHFGKTYLLHACSDEDDEEAANMKKHFHAFSSNHLIYCTVTTTGRENVLGYLGVKKKAVCSVRFSSIT